MNRIRIPGKEVVGIGYDVDSRSLEIELKGRRVYQFFSVPEPVYRDLLSARSPDEFFAREIIGAYKTLRLR